MLVRFCFKNLLIILLIFFSSSSLGDQNIIDQRINNFKNTELSIRKIRKLATSNDFEEIISEANFINNWAKNISNYFPNGSQSSISNNSDASMDIWLDFEKFKQLALSLEKFTGNIILSSKEKNLENLAISIRQTSETCTLCHRLFRN